MPTILPSLKKSGHLDQIHITICNVGSRKIGSHDDYATGHWSHFVPNLSIYGFDADADACDAANTDLQARQVNWSEKHVPLALSNTEGESMLYVTKAPMCSSLYPPNEEYLARFAGLSELVNLDFTIGLETTTLDAFCQTENLDEIDFLQVDVQGADLHVLEGAENILEKSILAIQIEVEFSCLYKKQPLFSDVDMYLRHRDFTLYDLATAYRPRAISPIRAQSRPGQLLWADAFYFRDLIDSNWSRKTPEQIFKLACIADALEFPDYTLEILEYLTLNYGDNQNYNFSQNIVESLGEFPGLIEIGLENIPIVKNIRDYLSDASLLRQ